MNHWIVQGNPKLYDIDGALGNLSRIMWRVPQYTDQIRTGDIALIWRSGAEAGIVGIGTFAGPPRLADLPEVEQPYVLDRSAEGSAATRAPLDVRPHPFVPKATLAEHPLLSHHQIVRAPMGTVFPVSDEEWQALGSILSVEPPPVAPDDDVSLPIPFAWKDRRKDTYPMPGGYDGYLDSLFIILDLVDEHRWTSDELAGRIIERFESSPTNARMCVLFLRRAGFFSEVAGQLELSPPARRILDTGDRELIVGLLHARVRLIGELLDLVSTPQTMDDLLDLANHRFDSGWTTKAQLQRRRGWLQSAGMVEMDEERRLSLTPAGRALLPRLSLQAPFDADEESGPAPTLGTGAEPDGIEIEEPLGAAPSVVTGSDRPATIVDGAELLIKRLQETSRDSTDPDSFEYTLRDCFDFLGFRAEKLGGSGKTDVLVDAVLGRDDSYRLIVDGKTTARGFVPDKQIDWDTIDEHRAKHEADYALIVGPDFSGERVFDRAASHRTMLVTVKDLAGLIRRHAESPIDLTELRPLFDDSSAELNIDRLADSVESRDRLVEIATAVMACIYDHAPEEGPLSARDLYFLLRSDAELEAKEDEIQESLDGLSSPFFGALRRDDERYSPTGPPATLAMRLGWLQRALASR